jgi:enterobacteria phage integrase
MCPAPRKPRNRGLPPNLYSHPRGYRYRRPDGSDCYLGHDRDAAAKAAVSANLSYAPKGSLYDKIVRGDSKSFGTFLAEYIADRLPGFEIKEGTRRERGYVLKRLQASSLGEKLVEEITTRDLHLYLQTLPSDWTRQSFRAQLMQAFSWAIQTGLREDNPASPLERPKAKRARLRLTLDHFKAIRDKAPRWLQNAMDLGLHTLQRPGDVVQMRWEQVGETALRVVQAKTGKRLELEIQPPLREVLTRCRDNVPSSFLVHRLPEKLRPRNMRAKARQEHTQVLLEQAEREFQQARKLSGLYEQEPNPPTLHEIRSLGASLYRESGWHEWQVQMLLGHSEIQMTKHYLKGHEAPWERVPAGLQTPGICY